MELTQCINYLLTTSQHTVFQFLSGKLSEYDLTPSQYGVLSCLWQREFATPKQISEILCLETSTISGVLDRMQKKGLIGKKSKEMKGFERMIRENIPVITSFRIGYAYRPEAIGKHIPCIIGKVEHEEDEQIIYVEEQNFEENTITDINGRKYFIDWLSMDPRQYQNLVAELNNKFPKKLKKYFMSFCGKGLKFDMIALNDSLPILGVAGAFKIK